MQSATLSFRLTVVPAEPPQDAFLLTPGDRIPNFGRNPTNRAVRGGSWSDPGVWSAGRVPAAGDVVNIVGVGVVYDVASAEKLAAVSLFDGGLLRFRTDVDTSLAVCTLLVREGGTLEVGTPSSPVTATARVIISDTPFDHAADPAEYGHGLLVLGKLALCGQEKTPFVKLASEAAAGATTLAMAAPVAGWLPGDKLFLPDSRHLGVNERGAKLVPQWETPAVASVSADGRVVTLASPLLFAHKGSRDHDGRIEFLPDVANLSRNVSVKSENASGTRGRLFATGRADVDVRNVGFGGLGRTRGVVSAPIDDTTFNADWGVLRQGTNQSGRYAVYFSHLYGPAVTPPGGYQFTFTGNVVQCPLTPMPFKWGVAVNDSHFGLISGNVLCNWWGCGFVTEGGNETGNVFDGNLAVRVNGDGKRAEGGNHGDEGIGFWFNGTANVARKNVATCVTGEPYSYGFLLSNIGVATDKSVRVPRWKGADTTRAGQYALTEVHGVPLAGFSDNEVYGCTSGGISVWSIGTRGWGGPNGTGGTIAGLRVWNVHNYTMFLYITSGLTFDRLVARGRGPGVDAANAVPACVYASDYLQANLTVANADIQGFKNGIDELANALGVTTVRDSFLRNDCNVKAFTPGGIYGGANLFARRMDLRGVRFAAPPDKPLVALRMVYNPADGWAHGVLVPDAYYFYDYQGVAGDSFRAYYTQQAADYVVPMTGTVVPSSQFPVAGASVAGLTNAQLWAGQGKAIAGAVCPAATTRAGFEGAFVGAV